MKENKAISFMAVAKGTESKEVERKLYMGLGAVGVLAVNPTKEESAKIFGTTPSAEEPKYVGETVVKNAKGEEVKAPQVRICFITQTDPKIGCNQGIDTKITVNYFLTKGYRYSTKNGVTKVQVIDEYGQTAWVTSEELKEGKIPEYEIKKGPNAGQTFKAQIFPGYRPAYIGEEELMQFIGALLSIPSPKVWNEDAHTYELKTNPAELKDSELRFDKNVIDAFFTGNVKELRDTIKFQPNNRLKLLFGVRVTQNGSVYQCAYTALPMKLAATNMKAFEDALKEDKAVGRHPSETYEVCNLKEYKVGATDYSKTENKVEDDPFASSAQQAPDEQPEPQVEMPMDTDPFGGAF